MDMTKSLVNESPRRGIGRRVAAAGMALAAVLTLGACKATGGGQIDDPVPGEVQVLVPGDPAARHRGAADRAERSVVRGGGQGRRRPSSRAPTGLR